MNGAAVIGAAGPGAEAPGACLTTAMGLPWPSTTARSADGQMMVGGADLTALARDHGTPAYVIDEATFRANARAYRAAFGPQVDVCYASKALLTKALARWAAEEGLHLDTASGAELAVALAGGMPAERVTLHGNNKSAQEISAALEAGIGRLVVDSLYEIGLISEIAARQGVVAPVMLRLLTGVHAGAHAYIATSHEDQKFGMSVADGSARAAARAIVADEHLHLVGLHSHIGSQILRPDGFVAAAEAVIRFRAEVAAETGHLVPEIDLGGGYGIAYLPGDMPLEPTAVAPAIKDAIARTSADVGLPEPRLSIEPGRSIVGPAGLTVYSVGTIKPVTVSGDDDETFIRTYVSVDGGISDNIRPALYGSVYHVELANRVSTAPPMLVRVVGKHCESGDILLSEGFLPSDLRAGDLLAFAATGAYGRSMASNYNLLPRPAVIAVSDGRAQTLLRRETVADILALDCG